MRICSSWTPMALCAMCLPVACRTCGRAGWYAEACSRPPTERSPGWLRHRLRYTGRTRIARISIPEQGQRQMSPSKVQQGEQRGWIVPIGGAEHKEHDARILERFVALCGGSEADIVVIPTASQLPETGTRYEEIFSGLGAGRVSALDFDTRRDAGEANRLERIERASGIFFTGGNQLRIATLIGGTPIAKLIRIRTAQGVHVAGTSAGASILSEHMIAFGKEGSSPASASATGSAGCSPRWPTTRLRSASAWTRTPPPSSVRTTRWRSKAAVRSPWWTPASCSSPRWTGPRRTSRSACLA